MENFNVFIFAMAVYIVCIAVGVGILFIAVKVVRSFWKPKPQATKILPKADDSPSVKFLKERCQKLEFKEVERDLFVEISRLLSTATTFDSLAQQMVEILCEKLNIKQAGILWKNTIAGKLEFRFQKGYSVPDDFKLSFSASIAGLCLQRKENVFITEPARNVLYVPLPGTREGNLLCVPIKMFNDYYGILRIANINTEAFSESAIISLFKMLSPFLSSALEKVLIAEQNQKHKNELLAITGISQVLHKSLDLTDVLTACAHEIQPVFNYSWCSMFRIGTNNTITPICSIPSEIQLDESEARSKIMLRNICMQKEPLFISNVHQTRIIDCHNPKIRSILSTSLLVNGNPTFSIVLASGTNREYTDEDLPALRLLANQMAITVERATYFAKQEELATKDGLTGLYNHRMFQERLKAEFERWRRYNRAFSLVMFDIDHFKKFNDTYGHQTGDMVLREVSACTQKAIRLTDIAFRYGGEEFAVLLPETPIGPACQFGQRLKNSIAQESLKTAKGDVKVTISVGVAEAGNESGAAESLIGSADRALYCSKDSGRNKVSICKGGKTFVYS